MKAETLQKRIESKLTLKDGKTVSKAYECVISLLVYPHRMHPVYWSRSGRHLNLVGSSQLSNTITGLQLLGIDFITGNDAPRGGQAGSFVELTKKGLDQTKEYRTFHPNVAAKDAAAEKERQALLAAEFKAKVTDIRDLISNSIELQDFISRRRISGDKDRTIAWKLTSNTRTPNLCNYSISQIFSAIRDN